MTLEPWTWIMRSFRLDPYLWIHLAGAAAAPIFLELCFLGLSVGDPMLPLGLEFLLVAVVGLVPVAWMQWQKPFYIFSLVAIALQPSQLTDSQRQILRLFKTPSIKVLTASVAVMLALVLWQLFHIPPIPATWVALMPQGRLSGLLIAAIALMLSHLFLQVPVSVLRVLLAREAEVSGLSPYPADQITQDFTVIGLRVSSILPEIILPEMTVPAPAPGPSAASIGMQSPNQVGAIVAEAELDDPWLTDESEETPSLASSPPTTPITATSESSVVSSQDAKNLHQASQPEASPSELSQSEPPQPEASQSELSQSEPPQPEAFQSELPQPETPQSELPQPEASQSEPLQPEASQLELSQSTPNDQSPAPQAADAIAAEDDARPLAKEDDINDQETEDQETELIVDAEVDPSSQPPQNYADASLDAGVDTSFANEWRSPELEPEPKPEPETGLASQEAAPAPTASASKPDSETTHDDTNDDTNWPDDDEVAAASPRADVPPSTNG